MLSIKTATSNQLQEIISLYRNCGKDMLSKGFDNWGDFYPTEEALKNDIERKKLLCLVEENVLLGVAVLDEIQSPQYETVTWQHITDRVLVVHRLAIAVNQQRKGYAKYFMKYAEEYAQKEQYEAIRLDAYSINEKLLKFYERLGYQSAKEAIYLGAEWKHPFVCFEKKIATFDKNRV